MVHHGNTEGTENCHGEQQLICFFLRAPSLHSGIESGTDEVVTDTDESCGATRAP